MHLQYPNTHDRFIEREANGENAVMGAGVTINMHLAAALALEQIYPTPATTIPHPGAIGTEAASSPMKVAANKHSSASGAVGPRAPVATNAHMASTASPAQNELLVRVVDGAIRESVVVTELSNSPVVNLVSGFLDAEAIRAREQLLAGVVSKSATERKCRESERVPNGGPRDLPEA